MVYMYYCRLKCYKIKSHLPTNIMELFNFYPQITCEFKEKKGAAQNKIKYLQ